MSQCKLYFQATVALIFGYIFSSMSVCAMLQSLQLLCTAGLLSVQALSSPLTSRPLTVAVAWSIGLVFMFGLSTLVFGVMVSCSACVCVCDCDCDFGSSSSCCSSSSSSSSSCSCGTS